MGVGENTGGPMIKGNTKNMKTRLEKLGQVERLMKNAGGCKLKTA